MEAEIVIYLLGEIFFVFKCKLKIEKSKILGTIVPVFADFRPPVFEPKSLFLVLFMVYRVWTILFDVDNKQ